MSGSAQPPVQIDRRHRIVLLRKRVLAGALAAFALAWAMIFGGIKSDVSSGSAGGAAQSEPREPAEPAQTAQTYLDPVTGQTYTVAADGSVSTAQQTAQAPAPVTTSSS
jgi:hypothetical protein